MDLSLSGQNGGIFHLVAVAVLFHRGTGLVLKLKLTSE